MMAFKRILDITFYFYILVLSVSSMSAAYGEEGKDYILIDLGKENKGVLLSQEEQADGITQPDVKAGVDCRKVPFPYIGPGYNHIYFGIDDHFIYGGNNEIWIVMEYFDTGTNLDCHYDSNGEGNVNGAFRGAGNGAFPNLKPGNTETWKTHVWYISDGRFENRTGGSDFRFSTCGQGDMWVNRVWVLKYKPSEPFDPENPDKRRISHSIEQEEFYQDYYLQSSAYWDENNKYFVLTQPKEGQAGRIFFNNPVEMRDWLAEFEIKVWNTGGVGSADGMTFAFLRDYDYPSMGASNLDFGGNGYGVEFDPYYLSPESDPQGQHIGLLKNNAENHLTATIIPSGFSDNKWHRIIVVFRNGQITTYYDDKEMISDYSIPNYEVFKGYFGFTAGTGGGWEYHAVRNIRFSRILQAAHEVKISAILAPGDLVEPTKPIAPAVKIFNLGKNDEANLSLKCEIKASGKTVYSDTQILGNLKSLKTQEVSFAQWTPGRDRMYDVRINIEIPDDSEKSNNTSIIKIAPTIFINVTNTARLLDKTGGECVIAGDYDNDGNIDLYDGRIYRNEGNGTFTDTTESTGVGAVKDLIDAALGDIDGDRDIDLAVVDAEGVSLYRNNGNGSFDIISANTTGIRQEKGRRSLCLADYDSDGALDIYVTGVGVNRLYRNNGDGTFQDVTEKAGVANNRWSEDAAFGDYNGDGKPDLYVANWGYTNTLYRNNGDGTFTDVSESAGVGHNGSAKAVVWLDYNMDGNLDIFVINSYKQNNVLYRNLGDGTFSNVTQEMGLALEGWGKGAVVLDYDQDGAPDIYVVDLKDGNHLYKNKEGKGFTDATRLAGVGDTGECNGAVSFDYDRDGDADIYIVRTGIAGILFDNGLK